MRYSGLFAIQNYDTEKIVQSEFNRSEVERFAKVLNDHERRNGRPEVYGVIEITKEELVILRRSRD